MHYQRISDCLVTAQIDATTGADDCGILARVVSVVDEPSECFAMKNLCIHIYEYDSRFNLPEVPRPLAPSP